MELKIIGVNTSILTKRKGFASFGAVIDSSELYLTASEIDKFVAAKKIVKLSDKPANKPVPDEVAEPVVEPDSDNPLQAVRSKRGRPKKG